MAEQFAIAEAKLRAWASMDDDEEEDSNDEEPSHAGKTHSFARSSGADALMSAFHLIVVFAVFTLTVAETDASSSPPLPPPTPPFFSIYAFIRRCSDFLLLPQTPPRAVLSQERHAGLSRPETASRPPSVPWALAAAAAAAAAASSRLRVHPTAVHPF